MIKLKKILTETFGDSTDNIIWTKPKIDSKLLLFMIKSIINKFNFKVKNNNDLKLARYIHKFENEFVNDDNSINGNKITRISKAWFNKQIKETDGINKLNIILNK